MFCSIIPDDLLKKIKDQKSLEIARSIREHRAYLLELRRKGRARIPTPTAGDEIRVLYDGHNNEQLDDAEKNILYIDYEQKHADVPTGPELEMFDKTWDFFTDDLKRESFDGKGAVWKIFKSVGVDFNNAFWNGEVFAFGDGDKVIFRTFWLQEICTHEATHAITERVAGLVYNGQSGALNEHVSDVFGICLDHKLGSKKWVIGDGIFTDVIKGDGLRTFENRLAYDDPILGKDSQPKHMSGLYIGTKDNGGVHINSGIPNHAFYAFVMRSGKNSWKEPLQVWWNTLQITKPYDNFQTFANNTLKVCPSELKGHLQAAWKDVGIITTEQGFDFFEALRNFFFWIISLFPLVRIK